jgi:hypothetical protein
MNPLHDDELDRALKSWRVPDPPPDLEAKTIRAFRAHPQRFSRWRNLFAMRVTVPLPAAAAMVVALIGLLAMLARIELTARPAGAPAPTVTGATAPSSWGGLQPVSELRPRIIRSHDENH